MNKNGGVKNFGCRKAEREGGTDRNQEKNTLEIV